MQPSNFFVSPGSASASAAVEAAPAEPAARAGARVSALLARVVAVLVLVALVSLWLWAALAIGKTELAGLPAALLGVLLGVLMSTLLAGLVLLALLSPLSPLSPLFNLPYSLVPRATFERLADAELPPVLNLEVALDGAVRPSLLQTVLHAAMVETQALGVTSGDTRPRFCVHRLDGAAVTYRFSANVEASGAAQADARHTLLSSVNKHLRFAGLRPVLPGVQGMQGMQGVSGIPVFEQRPHDLQRPEDQTFVVDQVELFDVFSPFERRLLVSALFVRHLAAGVQAVRCGEAGPSMFIVAAGVVQVQGQGPRGVLGPGNCFGEMSMLTGAPRGATVTALVPSVLFEVPHTVMAELLLQRPELVDALAQVLSQQQLLEPVAVTENALLGPTEIERAPAAEPAPDTHLAAKIAGDVRTFFSALPRPS